MKRIIIALLVCFLISTAVAESNYIGTWHVVAADGSEITDNEMQIVLSDDTAGVINWGANALNVTWVDNGTSITLTSEDGSKMELTKGEGTLTAVWDGIQYIFTQDTGFGAIEESTNSGIVSMNSFIGTWHSSKIFVFDEEFDAQEYMLDITMAISDGELTIINEAGENTFEARFIEGVLIAGEGEDSIECFLRDDGTMAFDIDSDGIPMTIIMERNA